MARPFEAIPVVNLIPEQPMNTGRLLADMYNQHGPIFRTTVFPNPTIFLVGPEANRFVLSSNRQLFSHKLGWGNFFDVLQMLGDGLLTMDGEEHTRHRRMMNPAFAINYMDRYLPIMNRIIRERVDGWIAAGEVDIYDEARKITFDIAAEALAGMRPGAEVEHFRDLYMALLFSEAQSPEEWMMKISKIRAELDAALLQKIHERRANPTDDILGMMVSVKDEDGTGLSDAQIIAHTNILLVAGHETSTSLSTWLIYLLTQHPDYAARVLQEQQQVLGSSDEPTLDQVKQMKVLHNALQEAERLYPPVPNGPRGVTQDFEFEGYHIPAGTFVLYAIAASHLNPKVFPDPEKFDPDRFAAPREEDKKNPYALVGFGGGPRICIGINFAQVEIKALASYVLRHADLELAPDQQIMQVYGATGFPLNGIKMRVREKVRYN
ncbi:MAG: cytochrome P450 [Anaerolineae bacterium]|nr:cytochrome P450 [Anaerolineae bacterium]